MSLSTLLKQCPELDEGINSVEGPALSEVEGPALSEVEGCILFFFFTLSLCAFVPFLLSLLIKYTT